MPACSRPPWPSGIPDSYGEGVRNKVGRNAASSWTQSGHLVRAAPTRPEHG